MKVNPTRNELQKIRERIDLAHRGHALLKKKQDVLINDFLSQVKAYRKAKEDIRHEVRETYKSLTYDIAYTGIFSSRSVAYATKKQFDINLSCENVMGLEVPVITTKRLDYVANSYEESPLLAKATRDFLDLFERLVELTRMEMRLKSLSEEIKKIRRRVNSLEFIQIPKLEETKRYISFMLEEEERDSFSRLKNVKMHMEGVEE